MDMPTSEAPVRVPDGLLACAITDAAGRIRGVNARFAELLQLRDAEAPACTLCELFDESLRNEVRAVAARAVGGVPHHVSWPARVRGQLQPQHFEWQLAPRLLHDGLSGLVVSVVPVEQQRREWRRMALSQDRFRTIAASLAAMVWVSGADGAVRNNNRAWRDFIGGDYPSPDLWRLVIHTDDYSRVIETRRTAAAAGPPSIVTYRLRRHDGSWRWIEERVILQDADGEELWVASCNDVTEQRELRERLEHSIAQTEGILNTALDAIITVDESNRVVGFNPAAEQMFGRSSAEMRGQDADTLVPARLRAGAEHPGFFDPAGGARRLGGPGVCGLRPDGSEFPVEASVSRVDTRGGRRVTAIIRDMTSQLRSLQALQDRKERLQLAMDTANLAGAEIEIATGRLIASRGAAQLLGLGPEPADWILSDFIKPVHPDDRARVQTVIQAIVQHDQPRDAEFRVIRPDGVRWLFGRARLYRDAQGRPRRVVGVLMDIHERKVAEEQLRMLSQRLLAVQEEERRHIARELHDQIGQSLTAAMINLQMLPLDRASGPAQEVQQALAAVLSQVRELSLNLRPSMLDSLGLEPALRWYLDRQAVLGKFEVSVDCLEPGVRLPPATETVLFRLVQEALTNVLRHARARHVHVAIEKDGAIARLRVNDDGVGFDTRTVLSRAIDGGSFGVVGMRERAELAGGSLRFESKPGEGTTVIAELPLG